MKYWLALWGWAARWLAHIWVLKYMKEKNIEISEVSGTSMWAIVGAFYASGMDIAEIESFAQEFKLYKLLDFDIKTWLLKGKKIEKLLHQKLWDLKIEDCPISLKIVATCLETWEKEVFTTGSVITALRASMSLPWILSPLEVDNKHYIDGWVSCNLPVEVLESKDVIAVSALKNLSWAFVKRKKIFHIDFPRSFFALNYEIVHRAVVIMMKQNESRSLATSEKKIHYILPDFWDLDYYSFDKIWEIIELGYSEAVEQINL